MTVLADDDVVMYGHPERLHHVHDEPAFGAAAAPARAVPVSFAPLRLVRDEHPSTRWSQSQYSVMSGGLVVGRISNDAQWVATGAPSWHWAINVVRWCFADAETADAFAQDHGGRRLALPPPKPRGPYDFS